mgnify:CR=1 FL=1
MLIPIRCYTCGEITGDKWSAFIESISEEKKKSNKIVTRNNLDIEYLDVKSDKKKSIEGEVLDKLGLEKYCCRRMILGNVNLISII